MYRSSDNDCRLVKLELMTTCDLPVFAMFNQVIMLARKRVAGYFAPGENKPSANIAYFYFKACGNRLQ